jgi:hypothetical protein
MRSLAALAALLLASCVETPDLEFADAPDAADAGFGDVSATRVAFDAGAADAAAPTPPPPPPAPSGAADAAPPSATCSGVRCVGEACGRCTQCVEHCHLAETCCPTKDEHVECRLDGRCKQRD